MHLHDACMFNIYCMCMSSYTRPPQRDTLPPVITHNLVDDASDPVLKAIRRLHLYNNHDDRVKVIFHPEFLSSSNPMLPMDYEEFVRGCHLGVFPSYYEPWGYTPGMLNVCCRLAGCHSASQPSARSWAYRLLPPTCLGLAAIWKNTLRIQVCTPYLPNAMPLTQPDSNGVYIVDRRFKAPHESIAQLATQMHEFCTLSRRQVHIWIDFSLN